MRRRWLVLVSVLVLVSTGGIAVADDGGGASTTAPILADSHVQACAAEVPAEFDDPDGTSADTIGWVEGFWYNEPLEIDPADGLDEAEVTNLTRRTAAQVEALRCKAFDGLPPLEFLTRDEYRDRVESSIEETPAAEWRYEQARLATQLYAGHDADPEEVYVEFQTGFPAAFYNFDEEFMGFIVEDADDIELNQVTLAHELVHALQDDHWDLNAVVGGETSDASMAGRSLVEGDADLLDTTFETNCNDGSWSTECNIPPAGEQADPAYWGLTLESLVTYEAPFVEAIHASDGYAGVDDVYQAVPTTMAEVLDPSTYGTFEVREPSVPDTSDEAWAPIEVDGEVPTDRLGQHALTAMLVAPTYETGGAVEVIPIDSFLTDPASGTVDYDVPTTDGWVGDRFVGYEDADGDVGSVWSIAFEDSDEAATFADAYGDLLEYREGAPLEAADHVYTFDDAAAYDMAVAVDQADDEVTIVTAPTVDDLSAVHGEVDLGAVGPTPTPGGTPTPTASSDGIPGFGVATTVVVLLGVGTAIYRRRRR